jgi:hypothetical protein
MRFDVASALRARASAAATLACSARISGGRWPLRASSAWALAPARVAAACPSAEAACCGSTTKSLAPGLTSSPRATYIDVTVPASGEAR